MNCYIQKYSFHLSRIASKISMSAERDIKYSTKNFCSQIFFSDMGTENLAISIYDIINQDFKSHISPQIGDYIAFIGVGFF